MSTVTERDQSIRQICDALESWIDNAEIVGGRGESLRCAGEQIRQFAVPTATKHAAMGEAVERGIVTSREASEIL